MKRSIYKMLKSLKSENSLSFHYPGHKGKQTNINWSDLLKVDTTEMIGTDNLQNPQGVIKESLIEAAKVFNTKATFYGVNGSTASIYAAISACTRTGDEVLIQRNCHKSVYNALLLNRLVPHYIYPHYNWKYNLATGIHCNELESLLKDNPKIKAVVLTNPNYFGVCLKLKEIVEITHKYDKILIVDEAHGGHLYFQKGNSALNYGADIVIHSTHKCFPGLTSTSLLHLQGEKVSKDKLQEALNIYTTTSPSYILILSNEGAVSFMEDEGRDLLTKNANYIRDFKYRINKIDGIKVFQGDPKDSTIGAVDDFKILIAINGKSGHQVLEELYRTYNIRLEMSDLYHALAICTVMDEKKDYDELESALKTMALNSTIEDIELYRYTSIRPSKAIEPYEAWEAPTKEIYLEDSWGEVASANIIAYPPGVPLVTYGEIISKEIIGLAKEYISKGIEVIGVTHEGKINVVRR